MSTISAGLVNATSLSVTGSVSGAVTATTLTATNLTANTVNAGTVSATTITGAVDLSGNLVVRGTTTFAGNLASNIDLSGNLVVRGTTTLAGNLASNIDLSGNLVVRGTTTLAGYAVGGNVDLSGNLVVRGNVAIDTSGQLTRNNLLASTYNFVEAAPAHISDDYVMKTIVPTANFPPGIATTSTSWPSNPANVGSSTVYNFTSNRFNFPGPYYDKQKNNIYTESSIESACECISENSVMRAGMLGTSKDRAARRNRAQIISENKDTYLRNNVNVAPGSQTKLTSGFDGGQYFSDAPFGSYSAAVDDNVINEFKTQVFDSTGPITRQLIPAPYRPFTTNENINTQSNVNTSLAGASKNVFFCINDGMGYNGVHSAKVVADMINTYQPFYLQDISGNTARANYMGSGVDNFKLVWESSGNVDVVYRYNATCAEMFRANDLPYLGVNPNRSKLTDPSGGLLINGPGINLVADSAAIASAFSSGRITGNEVINSVNDIDLGAQQYVYGNTVSPADVGNATGLVYFKTFHEEAKAVGKLTVVSSTSNVLHATPAGFISRSTSRNSYTALIRNCFGPLGTQINLLMGALPLSGSDRMPSSQLDTSSSALMTTYFGGLRTFNFPEILTDVSGSYFDSFSGKPIPAWKPSEYKLYTTGGATYAIASVLQYARHYGWLVCDTDTTRQQFLSGAVLSNAYGPVTTGQLTLNSKVFFANLGPATAAFMVPNNSADGSAISTVSGGPDNLTGFTNNNSAGIAKVSQRIVPTASWGQGTSNGYKTTTDAALGPGGGTALVSMSQYDLVNIGKTLLNASGIYATSSPNTFVWMHENSETDWGAHLGNFGSAAFETLESSYAQTQIYTDTSFVAITNIVQGCDHECGGWSFADLSGNIDYTDERLADPALSASFYNAMNAFKAANNVHLGSAFFQVDLTVPLNGTTNLTWDAATTNYKFDSSAWAYNLTDTSYVSLATAGAISYTDTSTCDIVFNDTMEVMRMYLANSPDANPLVAQFLQSAVGYTPAGFSLTDTSNFALISDLGIAANTVYFTSGLQTQNIPANPQYLNVRLPVSVLSRGLAWYKANINTSFTNYDNVIANVMYSAYNKARLYHVTMTGYLGDSLADQRYTVCKIAAGGGTFGSLTNCTSLPDMQVQRLTAYPYTALAVAGLGTARRCVSHAQPVGKRFFFNLSNRWFDIIYPQAYAGGPQSYYNHSNTVCRFWQKAPTLRQTFTQLGMTAWPGVAGATTPAQWLYNNPSVPRTLSSTSVRQVLDLSI